MNINEADQTYSLFSNICAIFLAVASVIKEIPWLKRSLNILAQS